MFDLFGKRFFQTVRKQAELQFGGQHPCVLAAARAAETGEQSEIEAAQSQLAALAPETSAALMEQVHKALREDPAALLDQWNGPGSPDPDRQN